MSDQPPASAPSQPEVNNSHQTGSSTTSSQNKKKKNKNKAKKPAPTADVSNHGDLIVPPPTESTSANTDSPVVINGSGGSGHEEPQPSTSGTGQTVEQLGAAERRKMEELKKALQLLKLSQQAGIGRAAAPEGIQPKNAIQASKKRYEFWETQPVPQLNEPEIPTPAINEAIDPNTDVAKVRQEGLNLPDGFVWVSVDIDNEAELQELYTLLYENYVEDDDNMFRFNYSRDFLLWVLKPPGWRSEWYTGVRVAAKPDQTKPGKLVGFVSAVPAKVRIYDKDFQSVEINFLCVHKKLRSKRMTPVLIKEITRRVNLTGIWQALYTAGVFIPKPISTCRYWHRSLNPKKLVETGFSSMTKNMNMSRMIKLYKVADQPQLAGIRQMDPKRDLEQVKNLFEVHMKKFDLVPQFELEELAHTLSPKKDVIECYVVERPVNGKNEIVAFFSFYVLPSTVMNHKVHKEINAAYSFYNVVATEDFTLTDLMQDALVVAKNSGMDVFNALNQMENDEFLQKLKFGSGDGALHYYLFNWKCAPLPPGKVGVVLQ